jgi:hypothetical protein
VSSIMSYVRQADFISWARFYIRRKDYKPQSYDAIKVVTPHDASKL